MNIKLTPEWIGWIEEGLGKIDWGNVCFKFIMEKGRIVRIVRNFEESKSIRKEPQS